MALASTAQHKYLSSVIVLDCLDIKIHEVIPPTTTVLSLAPLTELNKNNAYNFHTKLLVALCMKIAFVV